MSFRNARRRWVLVGLVVAALVIAGAAVAIVGDDSGLYRGGAPTAEFPRQPSAMESEGSDHLLDRDDFFMSRRTAGTNPLDNTQAGALRAQAARAAKNIKDSGAPSGPTTFAGAWDGTLGPNPIVQGLRTPGSQRYGAMAGRIGALVIRKDGTRILGAAQGGIWVWNGTTWVAKTDNLPSLATGALAVAPSNDNVVYAGTGEGALSGDSYFGNGILKSTDGGASWSHVSGDYFRGVATSRLVVDPADANHLWVAIARGRGGSRRTSPPDHSAYGIWESKNGGVAWTLLMGAPSGSFGATDFERDPLNGDLYASFWSDAMYKSTNGGTSWAKIMNGVPGDGYHAQNATRFSIAVAHAARQQNATLYMGTDWIDAQGYHYSRVFKSTNGGASWAILPGGAPNNPDNVEGYCGNSTGSQCTYDNVIEVDPTNPDIVYAGGMFNYPLGTGGIYRSDDGGQTWRDLGYDQHPDFHALAFDPKNSDHILMGNDGGVWYSAHRGGRIGANKPLSDVDWENLNGTVDPTTAGVTARTGLQIGQLTSIANVPQIAGRYWAGTQDNGTIRKSTASATWFDMYSGDGGQVLVDPTVDQTCQYADQGNTFTKSCYVYGTYYNIQPYRATDGGAYFFNRSYIRTGINLNDRSTFYIPWVMNKENPNQLFLGTQRVYRTDNARTPEATDVLWKPISGDLTLGCLGPAPNGGRSCTLSAIGIGGGGAIYTGSEDGSVWMSPNAKTSDNPTWKKLNTSGTKLPERPVTQFAVDRSNYRIAYIAYAGFNAATPTKPGHLFKTTNGGNSWTDISGGADPTKSLPDSPVNSVVLDPSYPNTLYVGTDVGAFVTYNGGSTWTTLGTGFPIVSVWQLDLNPSTASRVLMAGTHGRGALRLNDNSPAVPAFVLSKVDAGKPIGPNSQVTYTLTLRNIGNADATGVTITDPVPANTSYVAGSASDGGSLVNGAVKWTGLTVPKADADGQPGVIRVNFKVSVASALSNDVTSITNDGVVVNSAQGVGTTSSPFTTMIAPQYAVSVAPATQTDGGRGPVNVDYHVSLTNHGYATDSYSMSATNSQTGFTVSFFDSTCSTQAATTPSVAPGDSTNVCVRVHIDSGVGTTNVATIKATSVGNGVASATAQVKTIGVAVDTLLVDNDDNNPDVQQYYKDALTAANVPFTTWDLRADGPISQVFLNGFKNVLWFTGNSYPGPLVPYEAKLKAFLDAGNRLLVSGQDILDQAAGQTAFVHDYLHIAWDGSEAQNDKATAKVHSVNAAGILSNGIGDVAIDHGILGAAFEDQVTPIAPATAIFTDDASQPDALQFSGTYKVVFLAFPLEAYGTVAQKADLVTRVMTFFTP
jgi:uncharacterized repeat protein (TIGR01451 family)